MPHVEIYTIPGCGYCIRAKRLLEKKNVAYVEHDVSEDRAALDAMYAATERRTFPQVFIDGRGIGGCDELHDLDDDGALDRLLEASTKDGE